MRRAVGGGGCSRIQATTKSTSLHRCPVGEEQLQTKPRVYCSGTEQNVTVTDKNVVPVDLAINEIIYRSTQWTTCALLSKLTS